MNSPDTIRWLAIEGVEAQIRFFLDELRGELITKAVIESSDLKISQIAEDILALPYIGVVDPEEKEDLIKEGVIYNE